MDGQGGGEWASLGSDPEELFSSDTCRAPWEWLAR